MEKLEFNEVLIVHPAKLNFPLDLNKENSSTIQLTNKTKELVAYRFRSSPTLVVSPEYSDVGTILPHSTCSVTVTMKLRSIRHAVDILKERIYIMAFVADVGVKAEDLTMENVYAKAYQTSGSFELLVVYANSSSAVSEKNEEEGSLLHDNNSLQPSNNEEMKMVENSPPPAELVIPTTGGHGSTSRRRSEEDTRVKPSFKPFSPEEIHDATNNFSQSLMIGEGGYGKVYKCQLDNWDVAVKILDDQGDQGLKEYNKELVVLHAMRHENLINLMGTCFKFCALVYEYVPNGTLEDCLKERPRELTWEIRTRIVYEICTVLRFLHGQKPPLVHGDLKPHNVLLGSNFEVKLSGFGLCHYLTQGENSKPFHQTMHISGTAGYVDLDYVGSGKVTPAVDVYSLGKTVVRILTGQYPPDIFREVYVAKRRGSFMNIVDPTVMDWPEEVVDTLARFALRSVKPDRERSEFMGSFYSELELILDGIHN